MITIINAAELRGPNKHRFLITRILDLKPYEGFVLQNDHDPKPLLKSLDRKYPFEFRYTYQSGGPELWRVEIQRVTGIEDFSLDEIIDKNPSQAFELTFLGKEINYSLPLAELEVNRDLVRSLTENTIVARYPLNYTNWSWSFWESFVINNHHQYERSLCGELIPIVSKVVKIHGSEIPELGDIQLVFEQLKEDLESHCMIQENIHSKSSLEAEEELGSLNNEITSLLNRLHELTHGFKAPAESCPLTFGLYESLKVLCQDLQYHLFVEKRLMPHSRH